MKSIMHEKDGTCYLCMKLNQDFSVKPYVEEHHCIYGTGRRKWSEKFGLKVYLCKAHHTTGLFAVHRDINTANLLKVAAQNAFERKYPGEDFMKYFGKNYKSGGNE